MAKEKKRVAKRTFARHRRVRSPMHFSSYGTESILGILREHPGVSAEDLRTLVRAFVDDQMIWDLLEEARRVEANVTKLKHALDERIKGKKPKKVRRSNNRGGYADGTSMIP